jgi:hypothetical protein
MPTVADMVARGWRFTHAVEHAAVAGRWHDACELTVEGALVRAAVLAACSVHARHATMLLIHLQVRVLSATGAGPAWRKEVANIHAEVCSRQLIMALPTGLTTVHGLRLVTNFGHVFWLTSIPYPHVINGQVYAAA